MRSRPLVERRKRLATLLKKAAPDLRFSQELRGTKEELLRLAHQFHLEGLIAKRPDSLYDAGRRSGAWVKVKLTQQQELVIGGYTPPEGSRKYFGALLVGYQGSDGLLFAGRVGTGFSEKGLGASVLGCAEDQAGNVPLREPPRENTRSLASGHYPCGHETLPLG